MDSEYKCCDRQSIQTMDYKWPTFAPPEEIVTKINRICLRCYTHWFGVEGEIKKYTGKEWDALMNSALKDD